MPSPAALIRAAFDWFESCVPPKKKHTLWVCFFFEL